MTIHEHTIRLTKRPTFKEVMGDPATSYWLKNVLNNKHPQDGVMQARDPLDLLRDAEVLVVLLNDHLEANMRAGITTIGRTARYSNSR